MSQSDPSLAQALDARHRSQGSGHDRGGDHGHGDHGHGHGIARDADKSKLWIAGLLLGSFLIFEAIMAFVLNSVALLADAGHMVTDTGAIFLAIAALHWRKRRADGRFTYGWKRSEILAAQANGVTLLVFGGYVIYEAIMRFIHPESVEGWGVVIVAGIGVLVNIAATWTLARANRASLNVEGAFQHVLTDLYAFIATFSAGIVILSTGFVQADGIAALVVAATMLRAAFALLRDSGRVLLEGAPKGLDAHAVHDALLTAPGVRSVSDLHIWEITSGDYAATARVRTDPGADPRSIRERLEHLLDERHGIAHPTLQVESLATTAGADGSGLADAANGAWCPATE